MPVPWLLLGIYAPENHILGRGHHHRTPVALRLDKVIHRHDIGQLSDDEGAGRKFEDLNRNSQSIINSDFKFAERGVKPPRQDLRHPDRQEDVPRPQAQPFR